MISVHRLRLRLIGIMSDRTIGIEVFKNDTSIFQNNSRIPEQNETKSLIDTLRISQQKVNEFLTSLVEQERNVATEDQSEDSSSDSDGGQDFDSQVNPKKCKLTV